MIILKLLGESVSGALYELANNKLRAFLSILGITIGIFCIITVLAAVDSMQTNIMQSFQRLGENVIYIQRFPWAEDPDGSWQKYLRRPKANYNEFKELQGRLTHADAVAVMLFLKGKTAKHESYTVEDVDIFATTHDYYKIKDWQYEQGRYFSNAESQRGSNVVVIGNNIATALFPRQTDVVGKEITLLDKKMNIIGVLKKEGDDIIGFSDDNNIILPYNYAKTFIDVDAWNEPFIALKAMPGISSDELMDETRGVMRSIRKLNPKQDDNFALNEVSILGNIIALIFGVINKAGWAIGFFSILVGGFGIANIMFVSVKERTHLIGIKKALGAKRFFILVEFLTEAIVLCIIGGAFGLLLVYVESVILEPLISYRFEIDFPIHLSQANITIGIILSVGIGIVAGFIPALLASLMKPVDAIRG